MNIVEKFKAELRGFKYSEYLKNLRVLEKESDAQQELRVAVLRSYTVEAVAPVLKFRLLLEGFRSELLFGGYNQYAQEILDSTSSLYAFRPNIVLLMVRIEELMPDFVGDFGSDASVDWEARMRDAALDFAELVRTVQNRAAAQVVVQNLVLPDDSYWGVYDAQYPAGQNHLVGLFNRGLAEALKQIPGAFIWDFHRFVQNRGYDQIFDSKMWFFSKNPYKQSAYPQIVDDMMRYVLSILGKSKKCVVVDLDNTLWGGVVGEDGVHGIRLGHDYPGNCYRAMQVELLKLHHRGVILAINSKNNEADALEVIEHHPYMVLRREHFAVMQINWNDKASNIREIAKSLDIGADSLIMLDDNPVECEQIRQQVPECAVVCLPERPHMLAQVVRSLPGVDNIRLTDEDKRKGSMYRAQAARKEQQSSYRDLDDFLRSLDIEVAIEPASSFSLPRIAQLTQKTNQMNLTTRRYTESEIESLMNRPDAFVFSIASTDKFGDNGIIGVLIMLIEGAECRIDTFLLSCRVIGRKIETSILDFACEFANRKGVARMLGEFLPTARNAPAQEMYPAHGFELREDGLYSVELRDRAPLAPDYIRVVPGQGEMRPGAEQANL